MFDQHLFSTTNPPHCFPPPVFSDEVYSDLQQEARSCIHQLEAKGRRKVERDIYSNQNVTEPMYFGEGNTELKTKCTPRTRKLQTATKQNGTIATAVGHLRQIQAVRIT